MGFITNPKDGQSDDSSINSSELQYTAQAGANSSLPTYQEASGAPIEVNSPLGYSVGWVTVIFLNLSKMIGTGVFSTPAAVFKGAGSVGLALFYWVIGFFMAGSSLAVYLEFSSYFPSRSGSEVVYLEQSYPRPKYFFPTVFAMQSVLFSFSSSNAIVLAQYLFRLAEAESTPWKLKGVAVASYTVAVLVLAFNTKWSLRVSNAIGFVKLVTLIFIAITGLVVLGGKTSIKDPKANFRNAFEGSHQASVYGATNALVKVAFSYAGFENAFNVVNEVKNPVKTLRWSAPISLLLVATLYILANIAYFSAVTKDEILNSKVVAASIFFQKVFGTSGASRALNILICLSAFGNLLAVLIGQSRLLRECGRQGVLPWTRFWTSTRPFGTPLGPYALKWALTIIMILAPPAGDAFNFVVDLGVYPVNAFAFLLAIGLLLTRRHRTKNNIPPSDYRAWDVVVGFSILSNVYMLVAPWYPPATGANGGDVSFWYATYCAVGLGIIGLCGVYYYVWIKVLPRYGGYVYRQTILNMDDGATAHQLVKVPKDQVAKWDAEHDATGREKEPEAISSAVDIKVSTKHEIGV
ncbi:high affinity methionine permease [Aspergillus clavatus NRRL 1]|uniref:High affinity methionine permease n=1 Tax=Aspergillus clavatus (strain ATCC 1007 / CBS 513.65 / DSM 816 / NCTC 3887 / NRRL 1 / QM 1276 / 107) TaxID=344612 RepID=A1CGI5_ASPCL|nr:high affinity methionine permease [Aspergillus clavatus NRRL 1]EAW11065.1 high affinity methionine permease [Aspergillus clavatus NRRL 1]